MPKVTPQQYAQKWGDRLKGSLPDIKRGIENVTVAPTELAANAQDKMLQNITESINSGKWAAGLRRVNLNDWKDAAITKGLPRISAGVEGALSKMEAFGAELLPHIERGQSMIDGMADLSLEDSIARSTAWIRHMAEFKRS